MKPLSIADYLDRFGSAASDNEPKQRESLPFRPRSVPSPQAAASRSKPVFDRIPNMGGAGATEGEDTSRRTPWAPKPIPIESAPQQSPGDDPVKTEDVSRKLAEAYARGREEGLAAGRAAASDSHATELAAAREQAETQRQEFQLNEYAKLEDTIRSDLQQMGDKIGAAVTRILIPFLSEQFVKRAVNELSKAISRLSADRSAELIKIRGPERILALLRQRIVDLPVNVEYVEDERIETTVETNSTIIVAELRPWAELLASFEA